MESRAAISLKKCFKCYLVAYFWSHGHKLSIILYEWFSEFPPPITSPVRLPFSSTSLHTPHPTPLSRFLHFGPNTGQRGQMACNKVHKIIPVSQSTRGLGTQASLTQLAYRSCFLQAVVVGTTGSCFLSFWATSNQRVLPFLYNFVHVLCPVTKKIFKYYKTVSEVSRTAWPWQLCLNSFLSRLLLVCWVQIRTNAALDETAAHQ